MSSPELRLRFAEQIARLRDLSDTFDQGKSAEALKMVLPLGAIFQKDGSSTSLLSQLNANSVKLLSTAIEPPASATEWISLVRWDLDPSTSSFRAFPFFGSTKRLQKTVTRSTWWESEAICKHGHQRIRRDFFIKSLMNLGNCIPLDASLPQQSRWLVDGTPWQTTQLTEGAPARTIHIYDALTATLRQITYEVLNSPELISLTIHPDVSAGIVG